MIKRFFFVIFFSLATILLFSWGCSANQKPSKPLVIVSIPPYTSLVKAIAGKTLEVISALPKEYDPHTSEIAPRRVELLQKGALWIGIGESYEKNLRKALLQANPQMEMLQLTPQATLSSDSDHVACPGDHHHRDLHFWLSLKELRPQVLAITATLVRLWPNHRALYQERLTQLLKKIDQLDSQITTQIAPAQGQAIVTSHAALRYFCRDYQLIELALECHGKSPLPQTVAKITNAAKEKKALCAFTFPHQSKKALFLVANDLDLPIYSISLLDPDVLKTIKQLATDIAHSITRQNQKG